MSEGQFDFLVIALLGVFVCLVLYVIWLRMGLKIVKVTEDTKKEDTKKEDTKKEDTKKEDTKKEVTKKEVAKQTEKMTREKRDLIAKIEDLELTIKQLTESQVELPPVVYFSATAVGNQRSFHASKECDALKRVPKVCHAVACKICADKDD